jgi:hypothetical protein
MSEGVVAREQRHGVSYVLTVVVVGQLPSADVHVSRSSRIGGSVWQSGA